MKKRQKKSGSILKRRVQRKSSMLVEAHKPPAGLWVLEAIERILRATYGLVADAVPLDVLTRIATSGSSAAMQLLSDLILCGDPAWKKRGVTAYVVGTIPYVRITDPAAFIDYMCVLNPGMEDQINALFVATALHPGASQVVEWHATATMRLTTKKTRFT